MLNERYYQNILTSLNTDLISEIKYFQYFVKIKIPLEILN